MFDTIGTVIGVSTKAGMVDEKGNIQDLNKIFMADSVATIAGSCLGTSTTTTYVESASGVVAGGRSGLTAFTAACCFAIALLFAPFFTAIPGCATCAALFIVGLMMMSSVKNIDFDNYAESLPAFVTILFMPLTYSISDGIMLGVIAYVLLHVLTGRARKVNVMMYVLCVLFIIRYAIIR